ncbi:hypothetical protein ANO14919_019090 [Xylariales sp. No.14919]|nr:hypothetical protein ANO14919_019090 [Xylariales sp. No.14919]
MRLSLNIILGFICSIVLKLIVAIVITVVDVDEEDDI